MEFLHEDEIVLEERENVSSNVVVMYDVDGNEIWTFDGMTAREVQDGLNNFLPLINHAYRSGFGTGERNIQRKFRKLAGIKS